MCSTHLYIWSLVLFSKMFCRIILLYQIQLLAKNNFLCIGCCDFYIFYNGLGYGINGQTPFCRIRWYISGVFHTVLSLAVHIFLSCMECGYRLSDFLITDYLIIVLYIELNLSNIKVQKNEQNVYQLLVFSSWIKLASTSDAVEVYRVASQ